jgi:hypothetical protein
MDRFVTRAEAFPILKVVARPDVVTYEHVSESANEVPFEEPILRQLASPSHSPETALEIFAPLNRSLLRTLNDIESILAEAFKEVSVGSQISEYHSQTPRFAFNELNHDQKMEQAPVKAENTTPETILNGETDNPGHENMSINKQIWSNYDCLYTKMRAHETQSPMDTSSRNQPKMDKYTTKQPE